MSNPLLTRAAAAAIITLAAAVPWAPAATASPALWENSERTFYFHLMQYCESQSLIRWMDEFDWGNDLDGCGGNVLDPTSNSWTDHFPTFVPFYANVTTGTTAEIRIYILSRAVDQTTVEATFSTGYAECTGSDGPKTVTASQVSGFTEFVIACTFAVSGEPDSLTKPTMTVKTTATHTYGMGVEGDHASRVKLTGLVPDPPEVASEFFELGQRPRATFAVDELELEDNQTLPGPKKDAPAFGVLTPGLAVLIVAAVVSRRRRSL